MFGLGVGLLLASLLLTLFQGKNRILSQEEVEREARKLGMVYREEILTFSEPETLNKQPAEEKSNSDKEGPDKIIGSKPAQSEEQIKITIPRGSSSEKIGIILKDAGIITSEKEFSDFLYSRNLASKLKAGEFYFNKNATLEEVVGLITTK